MNEHSPLPWRVIKAHDDEPARIIDADDDEVAVELIDADAALIVEAANERDRLRYLVRRMAPTIQYQYDFMEEFRAIIPATPEQMRAWNKARAILAALIREAREALREGEP